MLLDLFVIASSIIYTISFCAGCSSVLHTAGPLLNAASPSITISGPLQVREGDTTQFSAKVNGLNDPSVLWFLNGIPGGNASVGTITSSGLFAPPLSTETVTLLCISAKDSSVHSSAIIQVLTPVPILNSATIVSLANDALMIDLKGMGFVPGSTVQVSGSTVPATVESSTEIVTQIPLNQAELMTVSLEVTNPDPGSSSSNSLPFAMPPAGMHQVAGCSNPNSGNPTNDFSNVEDPVYVDLTSSTQLIGNPQYDSNAIFWISRETNPGESILLTGAFTSSSKAAKVAELPVGTKDWQGFVDRVGVEVPVLQTGTTSLSFQVPKSFTAGIYGFKIEDSTAPPYYALANTPSITWAIGAPPIGVGTAISMRGIHTCSAVPGDTLRLFGKNFQPNQKVILESPSGGITSITPSSSDSTSIQANLPNTLSSGTYYMWVGQNPWDSTSSDIGLLVVADIPSTDSVYLSCPGVLGHGTDDVSSELQACLDIGAEEPTKRHFAYITIPNGSFYLAHSVSLHPGEVLSGSLESGTELRCGPLLPGNEGCLLLDQHTGLTNLLVDGPPQYSLAASHFQDGNPLTSGHIYLSNVLFSTTDVLPSSNVPVVALSGPDIQIYRSLFRSGTAVNLQISFGDGAIIGANQFDNATGLNAFGNSQNMVIEDNNIFSSSGPGAADAIYIARAFCAFCKSMLSQDIYVGYNTIENVGQHEVITQDGGGGAYYGYIASSTSTKVTLANDPSWWWTGDTDPEAASIVIMAGRGAGQYRTLMSYQGRDLILDEPWKVIPDSSSLVTVISSQRNIAIVHNILKDTVGSSVNIGDSIDTVVEDNSLEDSGEGIRIVGYGPYGGPAGYGSIINAEILRNSVHSGSGAYLTYSENNNVGGIGILDGTGAIVSGVVIRDNFVTPKQAIFSSNGYNGVNGDLIEHNAGIWVGPTAEQAPQFVVENNYTP